MAPRPKYFYGILTVLAIIIILTTSYWIDFFTNGDVNVVADKGYLDFEKSFPLADGWTVLAALISWVGLIGRKHWGVLFGIIAATGILIVGMIDILYNINTGKYLYLSTSPSMVFELLINILCLSLGILLIVLVWSNREALEGNSSHKL